MLIEELDTKVATMYVPASFAVHDPKRLIEFLRKYSFATLITNGDGVPFASHLPLMCEVDADGCAKLTGHMARANPQWRHFESNAELLAIFAGPHAYVSPTWYPTQPTVPTWNYAAVHVYGAARIIEDPDRVHEAMSKLVQFYEQPRDVPWDGELPANFRDQKIQAIVTFEIEVSRLDGKFKLGQNRSLEDQLSVYRHLSESNNMHDRELAEFMCQELDLYRPRED